MVFWQLIAKSGDGYRVRDTGSWANIEQFIEQFASTTDSSNSVVFSNVPTLVLLPSSMVSIRSLPVAGRITPTIARSLPWRLEDDLLDDIELLHIVLLDHQNDEAKLAVTSDSNMHRWCHWLSRAGVHDIQWLPSAFVLPHNDKSIFRLNQQDLQIVRYGQWDYAAGEAPWLFPLLKQLHDEQPDKVVVDIGEISNFTQLDAVAGPLPNLLQGKWKPKSALLGQWRLWQPTVIAALFCGMVFAINQLHTTHQLNNKAIKYKADAEQLYKQLYPSERIVVLKSQLQQKLAAMQPAQQSSFSLLRVLAAITTTLNAQPQFRAAKMDFDGDKLRIEATGPSFESFETLRQQLEAVSEPQLSATVDALVKHEDGVKGALIITAKEGA